ncbi:MAG: nickel-dependent hydrogenase large subunit [bacterium]|nr:nickel-dependent hydrogenase large subunit [bacterium]
MKTIIPIGPYHPLQEEPELFKLEVEGEKVVGLEINLGYNHRGHEWLAEKKTYDQVPFLVERICGICSNSHPLAGVQAIEDINNVDIPLRAKYIRTVIAELERLHSHFLWCGLAGHFLGYNTVWMWFWKYREPILDLFEKITGNRNHYGMMKVGGVRKDIREEDIPEIEKVLKLVEQKAMLFTKAILDDPVLAARLVNVGILTKQQGMDYGVIGPTARASGLAIDVRRDDPYAAYDLIKWDVIKFDEGDVMAKAKVRLLECFESLKIIRQCLKEMPKGPFDLKVDDVPAGEGIGRAEAPRGEVIHYVRSDGTNMPIRYKVRAPSYMNIASNAVAVKGCEIADAVLVLAAVDPCYCCTERLVVANNNGQKLSTKDLLKLSWQKTEKFRSKYKK